MRRYHHETTYHRPVSYHQHVRFVRRVKRGVLALIILTLLVGGALVADSLWQGRRSNEPSNASSVTTSTVLPSVKIFRSSYFQFQASQDWVEIAGETTANRYVYRSLDKNLIEQELNIYVNNDPLSKEATYILPVELQSETGFIAGPISEHCKKAVPATADRDPQQVNFKGVTFVCAPDNVSYNVVIGEIGGSTALRMKRPDNNTATYHITYRNVTVQPDAMELISIVNSFQTR